MEYIKQRKQHEKYSENNKCISIDTQKNMRLILVYKQMADVSKCTNMRCC